MYVNELFTPNCASSLSMTKRATHLRHQKMCANSEVILSQTDSELMISRRELFVWHEEKDLCTQLINNSANKVNT